MEKSGGKSSWYGKYLIIYRDSYMSGGVSDFLHQQYFTAQKHKSKTRFHSLRAKKKFSMSPLLYKYRDSSMSFLENTGVI